jgi:hypothetical protein
MPEKNKKTRVKDEHENHNEYYDTLGDDMKAFLDEVYLLDGGKYSGIRLTSGKRSKSPSGKFSHHHNGDAVDIAALNQGGVLGNELYSRLINTGDGLNLMNKYGLGIYDETDPANLKKTGGTGPHFHIGKDKKLYSSTKTRLAEYNSKSGKVAPKLSFHAKNQGFDYTNTESYKNSIISGTSFELPGVLNTTYTDPNLSRTFVQDIENTKKKEEKTDKKVSESEARKNVEKAKAKMLKAEQEKKKSFIKMLSDFAAPEAPREAVGKKPFKEMEFNQVGIQSSLPELPSIHRLPDFNKFEDGGEVKSPGYGWEYKKVGSDYLTRKTKDNPTYKNDKWIVTKDDVQYAIKNKIYNEGSSTPKITPERLKEVKSKLKTFNPKKTKAKASIERVQKMLVEVGYDLGNFGPKGDGIDGKFGDATKLALESFNSGIKPKHVQKPKTKAIVKEEAKEEKALEKKNKKLKKGVLPRFVTGTWREECTKDKGCSGATSRKMAELFGGVSNDLWADDAWFNRDSWEKKGAEVIYETPERNLSKMQKVPKELYDKFQIGDYVSLNRSGQQYEGKVHKYDKSTKNEKTEHLGFIIGKDEDGTPLVWHGSDMGTGYVQRIDEKITLDDHGNSISHYQIASVTRNPNLIGKEKELEKLGRTRFWTRDQGVASEAIDEKHVLIPTKNASLTQKQRAKTVNESIGQFKALGYSQEDIAYVGQLLVGGIMKMESSKGNNFLVPAKQAVAVALKDIDWFGLGDQPASPNLTREGILKGREASRGIYQMKPVMNFYDAEGNINERGQELEKLGIIPDDLMQGDSEAQTKAGMLILLNNYNKIKESENYDAKTDMYNGKIPAGYVLAKTWQAGPSWYEKDKYQNVLNNLDVSYSDGALDAAVDNIAIGGVPAEETGWLDAIWATMNGLPFELNPTGEIDDEVDYKNLGTDNEAALAERAKIVKAKIEQEREERIVNEAEWAKHNSPDSILYESPSESTSVNLNLQPIPDAPDMSSFLAKEEASKARGILSKLGVIDKEAIPTRGDGGEINSDSFIDLELTDEEIRKYEQGGYKIEYL